MKKLLLFTFILFGLFPNTTFAAEQSIESGLQFLKNKQDSAGRITTGFSSPSQWSAIAFQANSIASTSVKNPTTSLYEFLRTDVPTNDSATEWETRILAIVAIGENPTNFNGTNYIEKLESFYNTNQIGDTCSLNDDIFGLLALSAAGSTASEHIKQDILHFLITKQDDSDGGFGFSAPGCAWYSTSADMTAAGAQALITAKHTGMTHPKLDSAIDKATQYLLANQNSDGGFGYYGTSDTDTTGWVLIGFNALGMKDTAYAVQAKSYILAQQSPSDGGFMAFDWGTSSLVSNATTTAHALIALSGNTWILQIYTPASVSPTPSVTASTTPAPTTTPTSTPTPTPTPSQLTSVEQSNIIYQTITITTTPSPKKITKRTENNSSENIRGETIDKNLPSTTSVQPQVEPISKTVTVLGAATQNPVYIVISLGSFILSTFFIIRGIHKVKIKKQFTNRM